MDGIGTPQRERAPGAALSGFAAFLAVGLAGLAIDAAVFWTLAAAGTAPARGASMLAATLVTWQLNRRFTFAHSAGPVLVEGSRYTVVALVAQGASYLAFLLLCRIMPAIAPMVFLLLCSAGVAVFSFLGQRMFTFRQP